MGSPESMGSRRERGRDLARRQRSSNGIPRDTGESGEPRLANLRRQPLIDQPRRALFDLRVVEVEIRWPARLRESRVRLGRHHRARVRVRRRRAIRRWASLNARCTSRKASASPPRSGWVARAR